MDVLRADDWIVALVERYNIHSRKRHDLFGFADVMALHPVHGVKLIQVTSGSHVNDRIKKMQTEAFENVEAAILAPGVVVEVHGWRKVKVCTSCGEQKFGPNRMCKCTEKHGTRTKYVAIVKNITLSVLHEGANK